MMSKLKVTAEPGKHDIVATRVFDAPRARVFSAYTDPDAVPHWWGQRDFSTRVEQMDVQFGGAWRFVQADGAGNEYAFRGVYHEVDAPARLVNTFEFEGMPGHILMETTTFEETNGQTTLTTVSVFQSVADRDGALASGMNEGMAESLDRLEELVVKQAVA